MAFEEVKSSKSHTSSSLRLVFYSDKVHLPYLFASIWFGLVYISGLIYITILILILMESSPGRLHLREGHCQATGLQCSLVHLSAVNQLTNFWFCYFFMINQLDIRLFKVIQK